LEVGNTAHGRASKPEFLTTVYGMPNATTVSEQWFDEYLTVNAYEFSVEPDLSVKTRPDRLIKRTDRVAICEIKEFTVDALTRRWPKGGCQVGTFSAQDWFLTVRRTISAAARQLEPLADHGRPLVVMLANPNRTAVPIESGHELIQAMYGDLQITLEINTTTGDADGETEWTLGEGGRLAGEAAPWISGVAGLRAHDRANEFRRSWIDQWSSENWPKPPTTPEDGVAFVLAYQKELEAEMVNAPTGLYYTVELVEAISEKAVPVPRDIFDGEGDVRWIVNRAESRYERLE
jgi:hypothetical protein